MAIKEELIGIVGTESFFDDAAALRPYSQDYSLSAPCLPACAVQPKDAEEVQKVIQLANKNKLPVVPVSSGIHFYGNSIPVKDGLVMDLSRMNRILGIDERNRMVRVEPGVTWAQLQPELEKRDLMAICPLLPHPLKSVLTSHLEREPALIPKFEYTDNLVTMEVVLPDGELYRTGSACVSGFPDKSMADGVNPSGPDSIMWSRLLQGAQGTMAVLTWAQVKIEYRPRVNKTFFIPFQSAREAADFIYKVQRRLIGEECLLLNNCNLAAILARQWPEDFNTLRESLSPWTVVLVLDGGKRFPEEKIAYQEEALREVAAELSIPELPGLIPGQPGVEEEIPNMLRNAWPKERAYWKFASKSSCQDLFFHTVLSKAPAFAEAIGEVATRHGYPVNEIGFYIQPIAYGGACHFEASFYYNPDSAEEVTRIKSLFTEAAEVVLDRGGFFTRPYGFIADLVYSRSADYTATLRKFKEMLDPNNVLSPGRLCF